MASAARGGSSVAGSSPWATAYAADIRRAWLDDAEVAPRSVQRHLGPSELGVECDRQVAGKMAGLQTTNHVVDPWPSIRGRALHAHAEGVFGGDNTRHGDRWLTERRVTPHPDHPGTADLYDARWQAVVDHKFLGESSMAKIRADPPRKYRRQLYLYGLGYLREGLPVRRVVLVAYPATSGSLDGIYVHEWPFAAQGTLASLYAEPAAELLAVFADTARRTAQAAGIAAGRLTLRDVPATPGEECYFCPLFRPQAAHDSGPGCPGTTAPAPLSPDGGSNTH